MKVNQLKLQYSYFIPYIRLAVHAEPVVSSYAIVFFIAN